MSVLLYQLWSLNNLPLFHVDWWRIDQSLPSTDFIVSTSTHYQWLKSRNLSVPWCLQSLVASFPVFESELSSTTPARMILQVFDQQLIHSHSLDCAMVPWRSLSSLVVSLIYVNGLHKWPLIRWFHSCSTSIPFIHVRWNVPIWWWRRPWGKEETSFSSSLLPGSDWSFVILIHIYIET